MKETLKLSAPLEINGVKYTELTYDVDEITVDAFAEAGARKAKAVGVTAVSGAAEVDYVFHLYLGFAAVIATMPEVDYADLNRLKGRDVRKLMQVGRAFFIGSDDSTDEDSDEP